MRGRRRERSKRKGRNRERSKTMRGEKEELWECKDAMKRKEYSGGGLGGKIYEIF